MTDHRAEAAEWLDEHLALDPESASPARSRALSRAQFHLLAAIHDEQQVQTGLLTDLRGAIDDLAETLRPKPLISRDLTAMQDQVNATLGKLAAINPGGHVAGPSWPAEDSCDCGRALPCRHCEDEAAEGVRWPVDGMTAAEAGRAAQEAAEAVREAHSGDPDGQCPPPDAYVTILRADYDRLLDHQPAEAEPDTETVTLPRGVVDVAWARLEVAATDPAANQEYATRHRAAADALLAALNAANSPNPATGDDLSDPQPTEAPADAGDTERPTAANLGRIGWMRPSMSEPWFLVHEAPDGWSEDSTNDALWFADEQPDAIFTPFTPADFGWTVLGEGQVAVDREDLRMALGYVPDPEGSWACRRLHAVLDGATNPYARQEADDARD